METILQIMIPLALASGFLRLCLSPLRWFWKIGVNTLSGFACLWLLNLISGFTGIFFPLNAVTASVAGFLGLPGILFLVVMQLIL